MNNKVENIIKKAVAQYASENDITELMRPDSDTILFGKDSVIDSIGLVTIIVEVESRISEDLNITISLADEKALSQKNSPFKTIKSLTDYINKTLNKQK
ncbi:MAG: hypothetical protein IQL11_14535 [Bacteroidales bacterium]|nr:hypothetical protein [Bacteroidales bacterium]